MNFVGVKLALHAPTGEFNTVRLKSGPITELQDLLSEGLTTEVTTTFTRMGFLHDPHTILIWHTSEEKSIKSLSMQYSPLDCVALSYSPKGFPIISCCIVGERPISAEVLDVIIPWV